MLAVRDLSKSFRRLFGGGGATSVAVRSVSFEVAPGEIFGLLGPNGAGKSTTLKMILGLIAPTSGSALLFGEPPSPSNLRRTGFLPESPDVSPHLTPREFVTLCARLSDVDGAGVERILERTGAGEAIDRPAGTLSKGMLQRVGLAAALVHDPELLLLDEPMDGLDPMGRREVRDLLVEHKARGRGIVFSSHVLGDVETLCDRVCILRAGSVALQGTVAELLRARGTTEITLFEEGKTRLVTAADDDVNRVLEEALARGARVVRVNPQRETLEELFVRHSSA